MNENFYNQVEKYSARTDLAFEALDIKKIKKMDKNLDEEFEENNVSIRRIVLNQSIASEIDKKAGIYYTLDISKIATHDSDDLMSVENALTKVIKELLKFEQINGKMKGLVVGLGNINVTPDSLGPLVIDNVIVTRHMFLINPEEVSEGISDVSALAPGVMGTTGIETFDIIEAVVKKIDVDYIIVVDALAARSLSRVNKTIQVTNAGIAPGSGVGNKRKELSKETMGIPVIAIGVPTVVDAITIVNDTLEKVLKHFENDNSEYKKIILGEVGELNENDKRELFSEILSKNGSNMIVTPKEVDLEIEDLTKIISGAIDRSLHPLVDR